MYTGMLSDLHERGQSVQADNDELLMTTRWAKQPAHQQMDAMRERWYENTGELPVGLDVDCPSEKRISVHNS